MNRRELQERWLPFPGCPDYAISDLGRARRETTARGTAVGKVLTPRLDRHGYPTVNIRGPAQRRATTRYLHRAVLLAFVGPPPSPSHEGAHNDGVRANCALSNLRWATHHENCLDRNKHGSQPLGQQVAGARLTPEAVVLIRAAPGDVSTAALARRFGASASAVRHVRAGRTWRHL